VSWRRSPTAILAALTGLNLINYVDRGMTAAVLTLITADFHLSGFQGGLLGAAYICAYLVVAPVAGWLADHRPRLRLAGFGVLTWTVAIVASAVAPHFTILLLARAASGVGEATYSIVTPSLIADTYPAQRRGMALAIFFAALPVGAALAYVIGGNVGPAYGWRLSYLIVFVPAVILCWQIFTLREPKRGVHEGGAGLHDVSLMDSLRGLAQRRSYIYNTAAQTIFTFTLGGMWLWVPTFLSEERGITLARANTMFGILLVVSGIGGTVVGGKAGDALASRIRSAHFTFSAAATLLAVPLIAIALASHNEWVLWPCTFVGLFLLFTITGPLQASMMNVLPANLRGRGVAVYTVAIHLFGDVLSQPLMGLAKDAMGLEIPMIVAILFLAVSGFLLLLGRRALERDLIAAEEQSGAISLV
jgi:MFS transporter, Spinster family, sphingosine-1-phosphate transporter